MVIYFVMTVRHRRTRVFPQHNGFNCEVQCKYWFGFFRFFVHASKVEENKSPVVTTAIVWRLQRFCEKKIYIYIIYNNSGNTVKVFRKLCFFVAALYHSSPLLEKHFHTTILPWQTAFVSGQSGHYTNQCTMSEYLFLTFILQSNNCYNKNWERKLKSESCQITCWWSWTWLFLPQLGR